MLIQTSRFGALDVADSDIITFPHGIPGFEEYKRFVLIKHDPKGRFLWLQSVDLPELAFVVVESLSLISGYNPEIPMDQVADIGVDRPEVARVLSVVTIPQDVVNATVNLAAPIVLNPGLRQAKQVILEGTPYPLRYRLFADPGPAGAEGGKPDAGS